jgi:hypothetical protein
MANFKAQVEGITQLSVGASTTPTQDELSQFLVDGTREVTNRMIAVKPEELIKFTSSTHDSNNSGVALQGRVLSVVREHDSTTILRECTMINPGDRYNASDSESLTYRSAYNPGFYILDGKIHTVPISAAGNNDAIVTQVYYAVNQGHSSTSIDNFPNEYEYLVVLYASMRTVFAVMSSKAITTLSISAVPPDSVAFTALTSTALTEAGNLSGLDSITLASATTFSSVPTYTAPTVEGASTELTSMEAITGDAVGTDADFIDFEKWFTVVGELIEDEEDSELAASQLEKIGTYISAYSAQVNNNLNSFNEENVIYQAEIQNKMAVLQAALSNEVKAADLRMQQAIKNKEIDVQKEIQNETNRVQTIIQSATTAISNYQAELGTYQAEVATQIQEHQAAISESTAEYQWLQSQYAALKIEYDAAFIGANTAEALNRGEAPQQRPRDNRNRRGR